MRGRIPLLLAVGLALAACDGPTEPAVAFDVRFDVIDPPAAAIEMGGDGIPSIRCSVRVEAEASGPGKAAWTRVGIRRYSPVDPQTPLDSLIRPYASGPVFSRDTISRSRPDTATFEWWANEPVGLDFILWYRPRGAAVEQSVTQHLDCGPPLPVGAAPPTAEVLEVRGSDPVLEFGDTLIVRYRATSGGALYRTRMVVYGGFGVDRHIAEGFELLREREERFVVPRTAVLGTPIALWFTSFDVGGRYATASDTSAVVVVDVRPPVLSEVVVTPGQFMVGARLDLTATASDERALTHIVWEFGAPISFRDSIATGDPVTNVQIPVRPEWAGQQATLRVFARDGGGNYSTAWSSAADAFSFYPTGPIAGATFGALPTLNEIVYDRQRERLYAIDTYGASMTAFDLATMTSLATVPLPAWPGAADITLSGDSLLVTQSELRTLSVVDLNGLALVDTVPLPPVDSVAAVEGVNAPMPTGVRVLANGKAIVQLHREATGGSNSVEVDLGTGVSRLRTETSGGGGGVENWWSRMGVAPDRSWLVLLDSGCTRTYASATDTFSGCMAPDPGDLQAFGFGFDAASDRVIAGGRVLSRSLAPVATLPFVASQLTPDGAYAFGVVGEGLLKIRLSDGRIMGRLYLGGTPARLLLLDDGHTMLMLGEGFVTKFDTAPIP